MCMLYLYDYQWQLPDSVEAVKNSRIFCQNQSSLSNKLVKFLFVLFLKSVCFRRFSCMLFVHRYYNLQFDLQLDLFSE